MTLIVSAATGTV